MNVGQPATHPASGFGWRKPAAGDRLLQVYRLHCAEADLYPADSLVHSLRVQLPLAVGRRLRRHSMADICLSCAWGRSIFTRSQWLSCPHREEQQGRQSGDGLCWRLASCCLRRYC